MRYELGNADLTELAFTGTCIASIPYMDMTLDQNIDGEKLRQAVIVALTHHPLLKTQLIYDKKFYLETNNAPLVISHCPIEERPRDFGVRTNGYPFHICYWENRLSLEVFHGVTDGRGIIRFLTSLLEYYLTGACTPENTNCSLDTSYEAIYDEAVKPIGNKAQAKGFTWSHVPHSDSTTTSNLSILTLHTADLLHIARKMDTTPVALLAPLFSQAMRDVLPAKKRNRNVAGGIIVDCRKPMNRDCMHNFVTSKTITYVDKYDQFDLETLGTIYRTTLDLFCQKESIISDCTSLVKSTRTLFALRPLWLQHFIMKIVAKILKRTMFNFGLTYLGKVPFSEEITKHLVHFNFRNHSDLGYCILSIIDLNGTLVINLNENMKNTGLTDAFIKRCEQAGVSVTLESTSTFYQSAFTADCL